MSSKKERGNQKSELNIAIDGYSACGKSTLAKQLAQKLNLTYIDTGAMYRAITLLLIRNGKVNTLNSDATVEDLGLDPIEMSFQKDQNNHLVLIVNGESVESKIRKMEIAQHVSKVAEIPSVRKLLVGLQKKMAENGGVIMEGRDIGTVVLPNADLKIFMTAAPDVRATRRLKQLQNQGVESTMEKVRKNLVERDYIDENRSTDPLKKAADARVLDNSELTQEEQLKIVLNWVNQLK